MSRSREHVAWARRHRLSAGLLLVVLYLGMTAAIGISLGEGVIRPGRRPVTDSDRASAGQVASAHQARLEDLEQVTGDGVRLHAWLFTPAAPTGHAVLVLHGQANNRAGMLGYIEMLLSAGHQVLAPDARAHGNSGGRVASYGAVEAGDVRQWASRLRARAGSGCVYGFAESMGAAMLLQALDGGDLFCGAVVESSFATFREVAYDRIGSVMGAGSWVGRTVLRPVVEWGLLYVRGRYGVNLGSANPLAALQRSSVPVLLIHGQADTSIPLRHSRLLAAARPSGTTLWEVPGAEHCGAMGVEPAAFRTRVLERIGPGVERN